MSEEKGIKLPARSVVLALMKEGMQAKEKTAEISGKFGNRVKNQVENGGMDSAAFRIASGIYRLSQTNDLKAKDRLAHLRVYLDWVEEEMSNAGHVGNLDDMAKKPTAVEAAAGLSEPASDEPKDRLTTAQALEAFRKANEAAGMTEVADAPEPEKSAKPKRGRSPKLSVVGGGEPPSAPAEVAPETPPAPRLEDDEDWQRSAPTPPEPALAGAVH